VHLYRSAPVEMSSHTEKQYFGVFDQYYSRVRAFIRSIVRDDWISEDLTQEVFIRALKNWPTLKDRDRVKVWLFRIAKNLCLDYFRHEHSEARFKKSPDHSILPDCISPQESTLAQQEMTGCVQNHFRFLPENLRTVLWLFDAEGFSQKEIADILGIDIVNVKVRLHRARKKMREILKENCRFERDDRNVFVCIPCEEGSENRQENQHCL